MIYDTRGNKGKLGWPRVVGNRWEMIEWDSWGGGKTAVVTPVVFYFILHPTARVDNAESLDTPLRPLNWWNWYYYRTLLFRSVYFVVSNWRWPVSLISYKLLYTPSTRPWLTYWLFSKFPSAKIFSGWIDFWFFFACPLKNNIDFIKFKKNGFLKFEKRKKR